MNVLTGRASGPAADATALIARIAVGIVFIAHGWQKVSEMGMGGTAGMMESMGIPAPQAAALFAIVVELGGGVLLLVGLLQPVAGVLLALQMGGAILFVHAGNGLIGEGGYELPLALGLSALALGFNGGRFALDRLLPWGRERRPQEAAAA